MDFEFRIWCGECGNQIEEKDSVYCEDCIKILKKENEELKAELEEIKTNEGF